MTVEVKSAEQSDAPPQDVPRIERCEALEAAVRRRRDEMQRLHPDRRHPTDRSIRTQFERMDLLCRQLTSKPLQCTDLDWARDTAGVLKFIDGHARWKTESTRNAHRTALAAVLRNIRGFEEEAAAYAHAATHAAKEIIMPEIHDNTLRAGRREQYMPWEELARKVVNIPRGTTASALASVYTFAPPRRLQDYALMRVQHQSKMKGTPPEDLPVWQNHCVVDRDLRPTQFCFNIYKTKPTFGQQIIDVTPHVADALQAYIKAKGHEHGAVLFPNGDGEPHNNFSRVVSRTFQKHTGRPVSVDLLRHAFVTMALARRPTINERKALATHMAHSVATQSTYEICSPDLEPALRAQIERDTGGDGGGAAEALNGTRGPAREGSRK
jgi:hypothetical protein